MYQTKKVSQLETVGYAVVRECVDRPGYLWIDMSSYDGFLPNCQEKAHRMNATIPQWANDNPINTFVSLEIRVKRQD